MLLLPKKSSVFITVTGIAQSFNQSYTSYRAWASSHRKANLVVHMEDNQWIIVEPIFFYTRNGRVGTITQTKNGFSLSLAALFLLQAGIEQVIEGSLRLFLFRLGRSDGDWSQSHWLIGIIAG
jgi:hypothetical protein